MDTHFAPADRAPSEDLAWLARETVENPIVQAVLDTVEGYVMVLDEHRQILAANPELLQALGLPADSAILGLRAGEALACDHAPEGPNGCGTSQACSQCGALLAVLSAHVELHPVEGECRMSCHRDGRLLAAEYRVRATPLPLGEHTLMVLVLVDISAEKRRDVLESVFLHDVSNTLQGLRSMAEIIQNPKADPHVAAQRILDCSLRLREEFDRHRLLMAAEAGTYALRCDEVPVADLLARLESLYAARQRALAGRLHIHKPGPEVRVASDAELILRILENMVTNALEATAFDAPVEVAFSRQEGRACFQVSNPGVIEPQVALQIFQRSFSTKQGKGRGLGTFSMKLFGEAYLGGQVSFTSEAGQGTTFTLELPAL